MNFLRRALLAVIRRRGKFVIMFVILLAITNLVLAGFAIQQGTEYAGVLAREKLGGTITLAFDTRRAMESAMESSEDERTQGNFSGRLAFESEPVTKDMIDMMLTQENIVDCNYIVSASGEAIDFEPIETEMNDPGDDDPGAAQKPDRGGNDELGMEMPDVSVTGVSSTELYDGFGIILEGRDIVPEDAGTNAAVIETNLAEYNGIKIGDVMTIGSYSTDDTFEVTVVGIYEADGDSSAQTNSFQSMGMFFTNPYNLIYTDYRTAALIKSGAGADADSVIDSAVFYVDDPANIDKVLEEAGQMDIDWDKFTLDANDMAYEQMMSPIENVASFSKTAVYIIAIAGALILSLILMLSVKERMYETGVLLSMGEGKVKVIGQYAAEMILIAIVAFAISSVSGRYIAKAVGNELVDREISMYQEERQEEQNGGGMFGRLQENRFTTGRSGEVEYIDSITIEITADDYLKMVLVGFLIIIAGTIIPAVMIMRFNPKKILTKAI